MDKYLEEIKSYLEILDKSIVEKQINNIKNVVEQNMNNGKKFEELNLVSAEEQAKTILRSYNINSDIILKKSNFIKRKGKELVDAFNHLLNIMSKNDFKANLKIIFDILVLLIFISLVKIPFIAIRNIGESLLQNINFPLAYDIWGFVIEIVYIIVAVMIFINVFPKWFKKLKPSNNTNKDKKEVIVENKKIGNDLESISLTDNKDNND